MKKTIVLSVLILCLTAPAAAAGRINLKEHTGQWLQRDYAAASGVPTFGDGEDGPTVTPRRIDDSPAGALPFALVLGLGVSYGIYRKKTSK
ncbi:MAG: hypothetical protein LBH61_04985 [Dysgonamonadaceae bacterium]|jgi:hypothetical protein|nr:hypothetical protein [Dysgonamonadaceae bacterium]